MCRTLKLNVVAEGVETLEQRDFLRERACSQMQGYLFSKPLPAPQLARLLRAPPMLVSPPLQPGVEGGPKSAAPSRRKRAVV
jgi:predicted signal transduction protein with EAL and GGDEF domain